MRALELVRDEGARTVYDGTIARELLRSSPSATACSPARDLAAYEAVWSDPVEVAFAGRRVLTREGLSGVPATLARFDPSGGADALLAALDAGSSPTGTRRT